MAVDTRSAGATTAPVRRPIAGLWTPKKRTPRRKSAWAQTKVRAFSQNRVERRVRRTSDRGRVSMRATGTAGSCRSPSSAARRRTRPTAAACIRPAARARTAAAPSPARPTPSAPARRTTNAIGLTSAVVILAADDAALEHRVVRDQRVLDFDRADPQAADLEHVVGAPGVPVEPVGVLRVLVAGADPVPFDRVLGLLVLVPVAGADRIAADPQVADLARRRPASPSSSSSRAS